MRSRHRGLIAQGPWGAFVALAGVALVLSACGSRVSGQAIATAARHPIVRRTALSGGAQVGNTTPDGSTSNGATATTVPSGSSGSAATPTTEAGSSTSPTSSSGGVTNTGATTSGGSTGTGAPTGSTINLGNVGTYSGVIGAVFAGEAIVEELTQAILHGFLHRDG